MRWWEKNFPQEDRQIYEKATMGKKATLGSRPAILVIDVMYSFTGEEPKPILEAI